MAKIQQSPPNGMNSTYLPTRQYLKLKSSPHCQIKRRFSSVHSFLPPCFLDLNILFHILHIFTFWKTFSDLSMYHRILFRWLRGSGLAHWWLGDILCFGIPLLLFVRGVFPGSPSLNLFHHTQLVFINRIWDYLFILLFVNIISLYTVF